MVPEFSGNSNASEPTGGTSPRKCRPWPPSMEYFTALPLGVLYVFSDGLIVRLAGVRAIGLKVVVELNECSEKNKPRKIIHTCKESPLCKKVCEHLVIDVFIIIIRHV